MSASSGTAAETWPSAAPAPPWIRLATEGAPRDLGLDQGRACGDLLRRMAPAGARGGARRAALGLGRVVEALRATRPGAAGETGPLGALARELARHFPHLDERLAGLAAGAGIADRAALALAAEALGGGAAPRLRAAGVGAAGGALAAALDGLPAADALVLRVAVPDGGHRHLGLAPPGLPAVLAGVNERGLAGVALWPDAVGLHPSARGAASAALLLDGCIERFDSVETALEWCERRPGTGRVHLVFADASGARGAIEVDGERRRRVPVGAVPAGAPGAGAWLRLDPGGRALELGRGAERLGRACL